MSETANGITQLVGETLTAIDGMVNGSERVTLQTASGRTFVLHHVSDCCESVRLADVAGDVDSLIGFPILRAEESSNTDHDPEYEATMECPPSDSWTWTFYRIATMYGTVTLRWLGESNGYYSESVDFAEIT